jgi:hypothetical protein
MMRYYTDPRHPTPYTITCTEGHSKRPQYNPTIPIPAPDFISFYKTWEISVAMILPTFETVNVTLSPA